MTNFGGRRHFVAACFCAVCGVAVAAGSNASGQECDAGGPPVPYVTPTQTTCDPSDYISTPDSSTPAATPGPAMFSLPPPATVVPPTGPADIYTMLDVKDPMATTFSYQQVTAPYTDATGCKAFDAQGHTALHNCLCDKCFTQMQECDALMGCRVIAKCAWTSGCDPSAAITSPTSCYPIFGGGCVTQINQYGTGSVSTAIAQQLGLCGRNNGCPTM